MSGVGEDGGVAFSTLAYLAGLAAETVPALACQATSAGEWAAWRGEATRRVTDLLGGFPAARVPLAPVVTEQVDDGRVVRERVVFGSEEGVRVPAYFLRPAGLRQGQRVAGVLCLHGHGRGKDDVVGIAASGTDRLRLRALRYDYGRRLAERGYAVLAPDARAFGERGGDGMGCGWAMAASLLLGKTLVGLRVWDAMRAIDYLQSRPEVDPGRIGCVGLSWGGTHAIWTAALDDRVAATVVSGAFGRFGETLIAADECPCQYVPGILAVADLPDLVALIAPRPLLIEQGVDDPIASAGTVREAYGRVKELYRLLEAGERVALDRFAGGHRFDGGRAFPWLDRWIGGPSGERAAAATRRGG